MLLIPRSVLPLVLGFLMASIAPMAGAQDWQLVWSDEFAYNGALDPTKWTFETGGSGWGNNELQHYTDRPENARADGDHLVIEARRESFAGNGFTSARLNSATSWTYGRFEIRAQLPTGRGTWPAIWMLASQTTYGDEYWPDNGEIDIMEHVGFDPNVVHATVHTEAFNHLAGTQVGESVSVPTATTGFHVYALEWEPNEIRAYVDGALYFTFTRRPSWSWEEWPFDRPFHLLLNIAVGGNWGGSDTLGGTDPDGVDESVFPQEMRIDYVRVYQEANPGPTVTLDAPSGTVAAGESLRLEATATDPSGIARVDFVQDGIVLASDDEAPYELTIDDAASGCHAISARAVDATGYVAETGPADITIGDGCPEGTAWPFGVTPAPVPGDIEAERYDFGGAGVAYLDFGTANTGTVRLGESVDVDVVDGRTVVTDVTSREWLLYSIDVAEAGSHRVQATFAATTGGRLSLSLDGAALLTDVDLVATGGDDRFATATLGLVDLPAGRHVLRVDMRRAGFALDRISFSLRRGTDAESEPGNDLGLRLAPNPTSGRTEVVYTVPAAGHVDVRLVDALGRDVRTLAHGPHAPGEHATEVDAGALAPGVYTVVVQAQGDVMSRRVTMLR